MACPSSTSSPLLPTVNPSPSEKLFQKIPAQTFHLGDKMFVSIECCHGKTRIHIRKYSINPNGIHAPTNNGISLPPVLWEALHSQLISFRDSNTTENVLVLQKQLFISKILLDNHPDDDRFMINLQRMVQKRNHAFKFFPGHTLLTVDQINLLCNYSDPIRTIVKEKLITYTLAYFVKKELGPANECRSGFEGFSNLVESLCECVKFFIFLKINELFECYGCKVFYNNQLGHDCMTTSPFDKFAMYFEKALFALDWTLVAKEFVRENEKNANFKGLVWVDDFFDIIDTGYIFERVEALYV